MGDHVYQINRNGKQVKMHGNQVFPAHGWVRTKMAVSRRKATAKEGERSTPRDSAVGDPTASIEEEQPRKNQTSRRYNLRPRKWH